MFRVEAWRRFVDSAEADAARAAASNGGGSGAAGRGWTRDDLYDD